MKRSQILLLLLIVGVFAAFYYFDVQQYLNFESIKLKQVQWRERVDQHPVLYAGAYVLIYIFSTAFSIPGAILLTLLGGALFGLFQGTLLVSFASSIGASCAFLVARYLLQERVQKHFGRQLHVVNQGVESEGALYLFGLRLVPLFPFFVINVLMGLTNMKTRTFYLASQIGMLPATILYVNAGTQLAQLESLSGILSPLLIASFVGLAIFPFVAKYLLRVIKRMYYAP